MIRGKKFELNESDRKEIRRLESHEIEATCAIRAAASITIGMLIWQLPEYQVIAKLFGSVTNESAIS